MLSPEQGAELIADALIGRGSDTYKCILEAARETLSASGVDVDRSVAAWLSAINMRAQGATQRAQHAV